MFSISLAPIGPRVWRNEARLDPGAMVKTGSSGTELTFRLDRTRHVGYTAQFSGQGGITERASHQIDVSTILQPYPVVSTRTSPQAAKLVREKLAVRRERVSVVCGYSTRDQIYPPRLESGSGRELLVALPKHSLT